MNEHVRVRRDWIDVRHEYLQNDGRWMAAACAKPGFCRECNRLGERQPMPFIAMAWETGVDPLHAARIIIAAQLHIPIKQADDGYEIYASGFRRLSIAFHLEMLKGLPIADADALAARTVGDLISLVSMQEAA